MSKPDHDDTVEAIKILHESMCDSMKIIADQIEKLHNTVFTVMCLLCLAIVFFAMLGVLDG